MTRSKSCVSSTGSVSDLSNCIGRPLSHEFCRKRNKSPLNSGQEEKTTQSCALPVQCAAIFSGLSCTGRSGFDLKPVCNAENACFKRWTATGVWPRLSLLNRIV
jgi:hypothetical protein